MNILNDLAMSVELVEDARQAYSAATNKRKHFICEAYEEGHSLREIAAVARVSHQTVANVVAAGASTTTETNCRPPVK